MFKPAPVLTQIWRYPIKSMQGENLTTTWLDERGVLGDRAYALVDVETGFIVSAKHPRKWQKLLACRAVYCHEPQPNAPLPPVAITFPSGATITSDDLAVDSVLSGEFGHDVRLIQTSATPLLRESNRTPLDSNEEIIREEPIAIVAPAGTFFDYAPLHLLTTTTLHQLRTHYPNGTFSVQRFRPNLVVETETEGFAENAWLGQTLQFSEVVLKLIDPTPRCVVTTLAQDALPHDPQILRTISQQNSAASVTLVPGHVFKGVAGIYATIQQAGMLQTGINGELFDSQ